MWQVEYTDEFLAWWESLDGDAQDAVDRGVRLLEQFGPALGRPHVDTLAGSRIENLKELRTQYQGHPLRTLFAFDLRRTAILLLGGDKTGDERFYARMIPKAEQLYGLYLAELRREGLL